MKILDNIFSGLLSGEKTATVKKTQPKKPVMTETLKKNLNRHTFTDYPSSKELKEFKEFCDYLAKHKVKHFIIT